jgi:hypothetical protein
MGPVPTLGESQEFFLQHDETRHNPNKIKIMGTGKAQEMALCRMVIDVYKDAFTKCRHGAAVDEMALTGVQNKLNLAIDPAKVADYHARNRRLWKTILTT